MGRPEEQSTAPETRLAWHEHAWLALPIVLVIVGGALGGGCGGAAWGINQKVFRATKHPVLRYVWTGLISVAAVGAYVGLVTVFVSLSRP